MNVILITACPSGVATTFLAARGLERAAAQRGWKTSVEMHGQLAPLVPIDAATLEAAQLVVVAASAPVDLARFAGKRVFQAPISEALPDPRAFLTRAEAEARPWNPTVPANSTPPLPAATAGSPRIVAVTACPTGVAHTFMAAEALLQAGRGLGYPLRVETQGSVGAQDALTAEEIREADVVILACDIEVDPSRFVGKRVWRTSTGAALKKSTQTLREALDKATVLEGAKGERAAAPAGKSGQRGPYRHLLTGVSFMLPMVVAGGLLIALSFVFGIEAFKEKGTLAAALMDIGGGAAFKLMVPLLAGYIAYSIADRPGIAPGMVGGYLASTLGAGFLGGIAAGFIAGYGAQALSRYVKLPASMEALKPILIIPLVASLVTGLVMIYVIGAPVAALLSSVTTFLKTMNTGNALFLGALLGAMMCFDLGGPINKAAYAFGVGLISENTYGPMAAIMAAGMVPPIGMGIASMLARNKFSKPERDAGKAALALGLCFISEGAIPFMAKDPLRVIPVSVLGGAITGAMSMFFGVQLMAPHGGLFVLLIPHAVNHVLIYLLSIVAGSLVIGVGYALVKTGKAELPGTAATPTKESASVVGKSGAAVGSN
ncbi:PTS system, fructose-specific IIB component / PTS system, fructose-specific IIC component [Cystobacter fuscus]|uniref:protein-N(pi)-phosphohistidine--D-fructose phosphotransferase n=1 Tax=Cystobacter fuscus TaxID=43 RepID=A0A250ITU8_9BACT|nr:PTS fructose-like transporter subunit IIB [Cystobacter fuscus]ATB35174.1 PTS system, fructose-specific IIB component / PTS system, fructose-specific IIC component [Cystobacter fuscus]